MERVAAEALEMVVAAEELGFDVAWAAEHHTIEYTIGPDPTAHASEATPLTLEALRDNLMFGTPDHVVARIRHYEQLGVDHYCYGASFGLPHDVAMRSLELFGRQVMPHFMASPAPTR
jgi:alkanesulfonate monooxygenase SsuD/methylene tetrahydromethanopterin reductase-like flavin-dependent oxidoreductase (luciferase family)